MRDTIEAMSRRSLLLGAAVLVAAVAALAAPASAQQDARWLPWVGCWEPVDATGVEGGLLCIRPTAGGVEMLDVVDGEVSTTEVLAADGRSHPVTREGCTGEQSARFSADDRRLFLTSAFTCEEEFRRESSGLIAMTSPSTWVDVQTVQVGDREMAWVRHYREAPRDLVEEAGMSGITAGRGMALRTARLEAVAAADVDDVLEASREVSGEAVRAWVAEMREPFDLDADRLVELADAGVDPEIIDVMVAVTWPEHFHVDREAGEADRVADEYGPWTRRGYQAPYGFWSSRYYFGGFYSPYGYGYGGYGIYPGYRPTVIVVSPADGGDGRRGRIVNGRGYTRQPRTGSGSRPAVRTTGRGSSGSVSTGSGSGGSKGTPTGRKAKRRGGGGGDDGGGGGGTI